MRYLYLSFLLFFSFPRGNAQVKFVIEDILVSDYNFEYSKMLGIDITDIGFLYSDGPNLNFWCILYNKTKDTINFYDERFNFSMEYRFKGLVNRVDLNSLYIRDFLFVDSCTFTLLPGNKVKFYAGYTDLHLGAHYGETQVDYTSDLLQILPTIRLFYSDSTQLIENSEIRNIILHHDKITPYQETKNLIDSLIVETPYLEKVFYKRYNVHSRDWIDLRDSTIPSFRLWGKGKGANPSREGL